MATSSKNWLPSYAERRISRRKFMAGAAAGAGAAALIACGGGSGTVERISIDPSGVRKAGNVVYAQDDWKLADETKQGVPGGVLVQRNTADLTESMDPYLASQGRGDRFTDFGYEYLMVPNRGPGIDPASPEGKSMKGNLAESYEVSNDGLTYAFTLRKGVKYWPIAPVNGREMDTEDLKANLDYYLQVGANRASWVEVVAKHEVPDNRHLVITMNEPYAPFLTRLYDYNFAPKIAPKELVRNPQLLGSRMIGSSWMMLDKVEPSVTWEFKRFDDYWAGKAFIDRWHWPLITETAQAYAQFLAQNVVSHAPSARDALNLRRDAPQALMKANAIAVETANRANIGKIDPYTSPWKDPRVRIGMHKLMNWDAYLELESNVAQFRAAGVEPVLGYTTHVPYDPSYFLDPRKNELGDASSNYFYDPAAAKQMISAAGYPDGFDLDYWYRASDIATAHMDALKQSGLVKIIDHSLTAQEYADRVVARAEFKGIQYPSTSSGSDVDYLLFRNYHSKGPPNPWVNTTDYDDIITKQRREADPAKRAEYIKEFQRMVAKTFPILPGNHRSSSWTFEWPWVHNVNWGPNNRAWPDHWLHWLDPSMPRRNG